MNYIDFRMHGATRKPPFLNFIYVHSSVSAVSFEAQLCLFIVQAVCLNECMM